MNIDIQQLYNNSGDIVGFIISPLIKSNVSFEQKLLIEKQLREFIFTTYHNDQLKLYSDINLDTPSIVVINKINNIPIIKSTI